MWALVASLAVVVGIQWTILLTPTPGPVADRQCPVSQIRIGYRADLADHVDAKGPYRIAYCKPTGRIFARSEP